MRIHKQPPPRKHELTAGNTLTRTEVSRGCFIVITAMAGNHDGAAVQQTTRRPGSTHVCEFQL